MYCSLSRKGQSDTRQAMGELLKYTAIAPFLAMALAVLIVAVASADVVSGIEFAGALIVETADPVATTFGAILLALYMGAAMFFVLPDLQERTASVRATFARFCRVIVGEFTGPSNSDG